MKALVVAAAMAVAACQTAGSPLASVATARAEGPSATPFDTAPSNADYRARVDAAIATLGPNEKALIVFGANWCHDSKALAGWLADPRMRDVLATGLTPVYVDVGKPQTGKGRNLDIVRHFGIEALTSTPAMVVVDARGQPLNTAEDAVSWRNAASRSEDEVRAALGGYARLPATLPL